MRPSRSSTPRTQLRGLIEAPASTAPYRRAAGLRGLSSAASLKLTDDVCPCGHRLTTPRTQLRGLIEASAGPRWRSSTRRTPRTQLRGLIEAGRRVARQPRPCATPRTQLRGLIEAIEAAWWTGSVHRDSADSAPRPHL